MTSLAIGNPWLGWGLARDPFFQEALTPEADSLHPAEPLHVGREQELVLAANQVLGAASSRAIVQGEYGVGKTSFVSRLKTALADHGVLTHARPVRVTRDMRAREFEAEVLRALLHIRASLPEDQRPREADEDAAFWRRAARLVEGEDTLGGGAGALGVSVSQSPGRIPAERRDLSLYPEIAGAVARLSVPPAGPAHARRRVLLHVNNLENLARPARARTPRGRCSSTRATTSLSRTATGCSWARPSWRRACSRPSRRCTRSCRWSSTSSR